MLLLNTMLICTNDTGTRPENMSHLPYHAILCQNVKKHASLAACTVCCLISACGMQAKPSVADMDVIGNNWAPYRSLGSYYMWRLPIHQKPSKKKATTSDAFDAVPSSDVVPSVGVVPSIT